MSVSDAKASGTFLFRRVTMGTILKTKDLTKKYDNKIVVENSAGFLGSVLGVPVISIVLMVVYHRILRKYEKKK